MAWFPCDTCPYWLGLNPACPSCDAVRRRTRTGVEKIARLESERRARLERLNRLGRVPGIGLVGCGKSKRDGVHHARELYTGTLFCAALARSEREHDESYVLSARHGLLKLEDRVESYDYSIYDLSLGGRARWGHGVVAHLRTLFPDGLRVTFVLFAGAGYTRPVLDASRDLKLHKWSFEEPMAGMTLFERMSWLRHC